MPAVESAFFLWMTALLVIAATTIGFALPMYPRAGRKPRPSGFVPPAAPGPAALAARKAAEAARESREGWERARAQAEAAWAAYDEAEQVARQCRMAAAFPVLRQRRTRAEIADRERFLHRTAVAACRRRELSIEQLNEVLAHRGAWNPRKHPVAQETALREAVRDHRFASFRAATARESAAWEAAERDALALSSLRSRALAEALRVPAVAPVRGRAAVFPAPARLATH